LELRSGLNKTRFLAAWSELPEHVKAGYELRARSAPPPPEGTLASTAMANERNAAAVDVSSDESGGGCVSSAFSSDESVTTFELGVGADAAAAQNLYGRFLEAMHLEVAGRVYGLLGGRVFHTYALSGPVSHALHLKDVRKRLAHEFLSLQRGGSSGASAFGRGRKPRVGSDCRVYTCQPKSPGTTWLQVNLGPMREAGGRGAAPRPGRRAASAPGAVYHVVVQAGGTHAAVAGSGAAAKDRITGLILAALEAAVTYHGSNSLGSGKRGYASRL
jgi:hypothetical protein